jgi:hypothetical protein
MPTMLPLTVCDCLPFVLNVTFTSLAVWPLSLTTCALVRT